MTEEDLSTKLLFWEPEVIFEDKNGYRLVLLVDAFNEHLYWDVKWHSGGYDCYKEFDNFIDARDYFLKIYSEGKHDNN